MVGTNSAQILSTIHRAKSAHLQWRAYAQGLVAGVPIDQSKAPVKHTDCKFGLWYKGDGAAVLGHLQIFKDIGAAHESMHEIYEQIYNLVAQNNLDLAKQLMVDLMAVSVTLLDAISLLEKEVSADA